MCSALMMMCVMALLMMMAIGHDIDDHMSDYPLVTYQSTIQLLHKGSGYRLHSHAIGYGTGSGQQSVTGLQGAANHDNLFQLSSPYNGTMNPSGEPIKCGDQIRLKHIGTKKWLHSHLHTSPVSHNQEVSCFGDGGQGDTGDNWIIRCDTQYWQRQSPIEIVHVDTGLYLSARKSAMFNNHNCPGCPINGQLEIHGQKISSDQWTHWTSAEGVYFTNIAK